MALRQCRQSIAHQLETQTCFNSNECSEQLPPTITSTLIYGKSTFMQIYKDLQNPPSLFSCFFIMCEGYICSAAMQQ